MGHDLAAVEFRQPNLAELQDYTGTVGTERERARKRYSILMKFHEDNFYNTPQSAIYNNLGLCLLKIKKFDNFAGREISFAFSISFLPAQI